MEAYKKRAQAYYITHKKYVLTAAVFVGVLFLFLIGAIVIRLNRTQAPSATIAYTSTGFAPATLTLLVDNNGTDVLFVNDSDKPLDISESSTNPEVFQVGVVESKNITKPKKVHVSKSGIYTFSNNKEATQTAVIEVITTEQLQAQ